MNPPVLTAADDVRANHHAFWIAEEPTAADPDAYSNGLVRLQPGTAAVITGIYSGPVHVEVEIHDSTPQPQLDQWDAVVEFTLWSLEGRLRILELGGPGPQHIPELSTAGEGAYRVRLHATGRDIAFDQTVFDPVERYLIQVWLTEGDENDPLDEYKLTDETSRRFRRTTG